MAPITSSTPILVDETTYVSISTTSERNEPTPPPPLSTTAVAPLSPPALQIPPRFDDPFIDNLFNPDLPISPTTGYTQLEQIGDRLAPELRAVLAQKVTQAALRKAQRESEQKRTDLDTAEAKNALTHRMWREEVASYQQQLADLRASHDPPTLAGLVRLRECPEGFQANDGRLPDFIIHTVDGQTIQAPFVKYLEGTQYAAGTLGGENERVFLHPLFANPIVSIETYPDVLPNWLIQLLGSKSPAFATLVVEAHLLDDWGLSANIERYHDLDEAAVELGDEIARLQLQQADTLNSLRLCHARLARAEAGRRLAGLEALAHGHQDGDPEPLTRPIYSRRQAQRRAFVK